MLARSAASPDDIEMAAVAAALKRAAPKLLIVGAALGALVYAGLSMTAPRYQSQAELAIVAKAPSGAFADAKSTGGGDFVSKKMDKEAINTHIRALQSPDLMAKIADDLKLKDKPEFNAALGPVDMFDGWMRRIGFGGPRDGESERDRVMIVFRKQLEVYTAKQSRFIGIRFTSVDPALAASIANSLADAYRAALATQGISEIDEQQNVLQGKIETPTPELAAVKLTSRAQPSSVPDFPKKIPLSALVAVAWLLFGTAWTVTRALLNDARGGDAEAPAPRVVVVPSHVGRSEPTIAKPAPTSRATLESESSAAGTDRRQPVTSIAVLARRIEGNRTVNGGYRTMIAGDASGVDAAEEAIELVKALADSGAQVILVDCSRSGQGLRRHVGTASGPGLSDLLQGVVHFEDVIVRFPSSGAHFIGRGGASYSSTLDPDQLNLILDALDETYEHIVVAGPHDDARDLFEAIEGRFDAGVQVGEPKRRIASLDDANDIFLGFEVAEIDVIRFERRPASSSISQDRIARATVRYGADVRAS